MKSKPPAGHGAPLRPAGRNSRSGTSTTLQCTCTVCKQLRSLPYITCNFICSQLASQHVSSKFGNRYSVSDKLFALGLFYKSPAAYRYRFMGKCFQLPSKRTLRDYNGQFSMSCGFQSDHWKALEKHAESMAQCERYCVLTCLCAVNCSTVSIRTEC